MQADAIPQQSRAATGVRLQRIDTGDRLAEVVLVPPAPEGEEVELGGSAALALSDGDTPTESFDRPDGENPSESIDSSDGEAAD
jgi:DNA gyrase subunit A